MPGLFLILAVGTVVYAGVRYFAGDKTSVKDKT